jgi:lysophospholipase L1-like esterase
MTSDTESIDVNFTVITEKEEPYFAYSVDGAEPVRQHITESKIILPDDGKHTVRIIADGMTESESKWREERGFALKSVVPVQGGRIFGIRPENKIIFYYGDSITEGVRALNMSATSNGNSAVNAYPWFCSEKLGAVTYSVGYGASGVTVPGSFNTFLHAIDYNSYGRKVDDGMTPDVIVVNHGTNDRSASEETFKTELLLAVSRLREKYPDAPIIYMIPFNQSRAEEIAEVMGGFENAYVVQTQGWNITMTDLYHPDTSGAKIAGENLADELLRIVGEDFFS